MNRHTPSNTWSVQDAEAHFEEVIEAAAKAPQLVTRNGEEAVVVLAADEYRRLEQIEQKKKPTLGEWLLAIPKDGTDEDIFPRARIKLRDVEF